MRKPERLLLRIEGRSPNDDPATFRIKFAGSFAALAPQKQLDTPSIKQSEVNADSGVQVNSVGTIVAVAPKPQPTVAAKPKETIAEVKKPQPVEKPKSTRTEPVKKETASTAKPKPSPKPPAKTAPAKEAEPAKKSGGDTAKKEPTTAKTTPKKTSGVVTVFNKTPKPKTPTAPAVKPEKKTASPVEPKPDPLAKIHLVVELKDGSVIQRPMSEIRRFGVENGQLTIVAKNGTTVKYSIIDEVARFTVE